MRALAKDPALRFCSAREMADELRARARAGGAVSADTQQATAGDRRPTQAASRPA